MPDTRPQVTGRSAIVVGAGIGGLAAAVGLRRSGWDVRVLERRTASDVAAQPGAGISIWPNGLRALAALGLDGRLLAGPVVGGLGRVRSASGRWLARTDLGEAVRHRFGLPLIITTRERLVVALADALGDGLVEYGVEVEAVDAAAAAVRSGGHAWEAGLIVVADGARSRLRGAVLGTDPRLRYAGSTSWRFLAPRPTGPVEPAETLGPGGQRFAILPVDAERVYCYALAASAPDERAADERGELRTRFSSWHAPIPELLASVAPDAIIRTDIGYLGDPPAVWHRHRVALLGDAVHAMTPDLGQGGCVALEDAATLAALVPARLSGGEVERALADYSRQRARRAAHIARRSLHTGQLHQLPTWLRILAARGSGAVPGWVIARSLDRILSWEPPPA